MKTKPIKTTLIVMLIVAIIAIVITSPYLAHRSMGPHDCGVWGWLDNVFK